MIYKFYVNGKYRASCAEKRKEEVKRYIEDKYKGQDIEIKEFKVNTIEVSEEIEKLIKILKSDNTDKL